MTDPAIMTLLTQAQNAVGRLFNHRARHLGLTRPQWRVISGLYGRSGLSQSELAAIVAIDRSPLGKIIDTLEAAGWVERRPDPDDRRVKRLYLTPEIEPLLEPTRAIGLVLEDDLLAEFSQAERAGLRDALTRLQQAAEASWAAEANAAAAEKIKVTAVTTPKRSNGFQRRDHATDEP